MTPFVSPPPVIEITLSAANAVWPMPGWSHRIPLSFQTSFDGPPLSDVPLLLKLDAQRFDYSLATSSGVDLRITDENGALLSFEIESWEPNGTSIIWFKAPSLTSGVPLTFFLYFGNPAASDAQEPPAVWSNAYVAVWHMNSNVTDSMLPSATGSVLDAALVDGPLAKAFDFNGSSAHLDLGAHPRFALSGHLSLEAWVKPADHSRDAADRVLSNKSLWSDIAGFELELNPALDTLTALAGRKDFLRASNTLWADQWRYLSANINGNSGSLFVDAINLTSDSTVGTLSPSTSHLNIGRRAGNGDYINGAIDEVRISSSPRSPAWFLVQQRSMRDVLLTFLAPEGY